MKKNKKSKLENNTTNEARSFQDEIIRGNVISLKDLIAPAGIDVSHTNYMEIVSNKTRFARNMIVSTIPRMCTFPEFLRGMYTFGDVNVSVFINPISESSSQTELNRTFN